MLPLTSILQMLFSHPVHQTKDLPADGRQADQKPSAALEKKKFIMTTSILMLKPLGDGQSDVASKH